MQNSPLGFSIPAINILENPRNMHAFPLDFGKLTTNEGMISIFASRTTKQAICIDISPHSILPRDLVLIFLY
jgi:hypothetical protein